MPMNNRDRPVDPAPDVESIGRQMAIAAGVNPDNQQQLDLFIVKFARHFKTLDDAEIKEAAAKAKPISYGFILLGGALSIILTAIAGALAPGWVTWGISHLPGGGAK